MGENTHPTTEYPDLEDQLDNWAEESGQLVESIKTRSDHDLTTSDVLAYMVQSLTAEVVDNRIITRGVLREVLDRITGMQVLPQ